MSDSVIMTVMDQDLPDSIILQHLVDFMNQPDVNWRIALGDDYIPIPRNVRMDIVTKAFLKEYFDIGFGSGYRVLVALGGICNMHHGIIKSNYCFVTMYFNGEKQVITTDFHDEFR